MILIDFSQIAISSAIQYQFSTKEPLDEDLLRHILLSNILFYKKMFGVESKNICLCLDGHNYWRKDVFPLYKQNRKRDHEASKFDWDKFFIIFNRIKTEFKERLPFYSIEVNQCEADDIIAILSGLRSPFEDVVIVSSDKDFLQLQNIYNVKQYSPHHKNYITKNINGYDLFEHIVRGDPGDGIPNILSNDDVFIKHSVRSKPIRKTLLEEWKRFGGIDKPEHFCKDEAMLNRFIRNRKLIDLTQIPEAIGTEIVETFTNLEDHSQRNTFHYLVEHKLMKILKNNLL